MSQAAGGRVRDHLGPGRTNVRKSKHLISARKSNVARNIQRCRYYQPFSARWIGRSADASRSRPDEVAIRRAKTTVITVSPHTVSPRCQACRGTRTDGRSGERIGSDAPKPIHQPFWSKLVCDEIGIGHRHQPSIWAGMNITAPLFIVFDNLGMIRCASGTGHCGKRRPRHNRTELRQE